MTISLSQHWPLLVVTLWLVAVSTSGLPGTDMCHFTDNESSKAVQDGKLKIAPLAGHIYKSFETRESESYEYSVGICTNPNTAKVSAAVIQQKVENAEPVGDPRIIGTLSNTRIMSGDDWVVLEYKGGDTYPESCNNEERRAVIMLQCDPEVDDSSAEMVFLHEEHKKETDCYYLFELRHQAVCLANYASSSGLSVGSILLIVFISVASLYLLLGFLYSRFVLGSKGLEQIPNYEFWKDFGNLQADGCDFVCRTKGRERSLGFGGIGDDQLDHTEEIRDDNLLPM